MLLAHLDGTAASPSGVRLRRRNEHHSLGFTFGVDESACGMRIRDGFFAAFGASRAGSKSLPFARSCGKTELSCRTQREAGGGSGFGASWEKKIFLAPSTLLLASTPSDI